MSFCLRAVIETENTFDDGFQIDRNREAARPAAVRAGTMFVPAQSHAKRSVKGFDRAAEPYNPAGAILAHHFQAVLPGKRANFLKIRCGCAMQARKLFAGQIYSLAG